MFAYAATIRGVGYRTGQSLHHLVIQHTGNMAKQHIERLNLRLSPKTWRTLGQKLVNLVNLVNLENLVNLAMVTVRGYKLFMCPSWSQPQPIFNKYYLHFGSFQKYIVIKF